MKSYALMGCVALFLFSIFHEAHQQLNMCSEYSNYVLPVRNEELPEPEVQIDVRRIYQTSLPEHACLLVAWNSERCGPIHFLGNVLLTDTDPHLIEIISFNRAETMIWVTEVIVERMSGDHHIYRMQFVKCSVWHETKQNLIPYPLEAETIDRFNSSYAVIAIDGNRLNYAIKTCRRNTTIPQNRNFFERGGCLLAKHTIGEPHYNSFRTVISHLYANFANNPLQDVAAEVPVASDDDP